MLIRWLKLVGLSVTSHFIFATNAVAKPSLTAQIEALRQKYHLVAASVAVIENNHFVFLKGFGQRSLESKEKVDIHTRFQAASISKPLTALMTLAYYQKHLMSLDKPVNEYLKTWHIPKSPFSQQFGVTTREILAHRSGLSNYRFKGFRQDEKVATLLDMLTGRPPAKTPAIKLIRKPNQKFEYCPAAYTVLQQLLDDVTQDPFLDFANKALLLPLKMQDSDWHQHIKDFPNDNWARAYLPGPKPLEQGPYVFPSLSSGGLWTTPHDLALVLMDCHRALKGEKSFFSKAVVKTLLSPSPNWQWGHGVEINVNALAQHQKQQPYIMHGGWNSAYLSLFLFDVKKGRGVIVMENTAPLMTFKGTVKEYDFLLDVVKAVDDFYH